MLTEIELDLCRRYIQAWPKSITIDESDCYDLIAGMKEIMNWLRSCKEDEERLSFYGKILGVTSEKLKSFLQDHDEKCFQP